MDNRSFKRLEYRVLRHPPSAADIVAFLGELKEKLDERGLTLKGVTTDGSPLYPKPLAQVFPGVPHQLCRFHMIKELIKAILHALAKARKDLTRGLPSAPRGRPSKTKRKQADKTRRIKAKATALFDDRKLFVKRRLTPAEHRKLLNMTRGLDHLRALRSVMDEVYGLFDRRCRTETALAKLAKLRSRARRFKKVGKTLTRLFTPGLEKTLAFLNDKLLPSTSNAVERGNRRFRKMQKSVYRVRTQNNLENRINMDLVRETRAAQRRQTTQTLHKDRMSPQYSVLVL